jgi:ubiquinone/menaquinone biosynthesis C-methylase UbiE
LETIQNISEAFSKQATSFDEVDSSNAILQWMRNIVHAHCMKYYTAGEKILELNCGTGIDGIFFAEQGLKVYATDIAEGMLNELKRKVELRNLQSGITVQQCSFNHLENIPEKNFNHIFSNFGGLNCIKEIDNVITQFKKLLAPKGTVTLVIMPSVCPWEIALALKGNFKTAFRRLKKNGADSNVEGIHFTSHYFSPSQLIQYFGKEYKVKELRGLASIAPPPYLENIPKKYPKLFKTLTSLDEKLSHRFPFNRWADHFILTMQLKEA